MVAGNIVGTTKDCGRSAIVPRFYFDFVDGSRTSDLEGQELRDLTEARRLAVSALREMAGAEVGTGGLTLSNRIEVYDADRRLIFEITYGDVIDIRA